MLFSLSCIFISSYAILILKHVLKTRYTYHFSFFYIFVIKSLDHSKITMRIQLWFAVNLFFSLLQQNLFHGEVQWHTWPAAIGSSCVQLWPKAKGNQSILSRSSNEAFHLAPLWTNMVPNFQYFEVLSSKCSKKGMISIRLINILWIYIQK